MNLSDVIKRPLITEKATLMKGTSNAVLFAVDTRANKKEVREAVEKMFKVKVVDVRTMIVAGKVKRRGRTVGLRPGWKKAVVTLKEGDKIEFFEASDGRPRRRRDEDGYPQIQADIPRAAGMTVLTTEDLTPKNPSGRSPKA